MGAVQSEMERVLSEDVDDVALRFSQEEAEETVTILVRTGESESVLVAPRSALVRKSIVRHLGTKIGACLFQGRDTTSDETFDDIGIEDNGKLTVHQKIEAVETAKCDPRGMYSFSEESTGLTITKRDGRAYWIGSPGVPKDSCAAFEMQWKSSSTGDEAHYIAITCRDPSDWQYPERDIGCAVVEEHADCIAMSVHGHLYNKGRNRTSALNNPCWEAGTTSTLVLNRIEGSSITWITSSGSVTLNVPELFTEAAEWHPVFYSYANMEVHVSLTDPPSCPPASGRI